MCNSLPGDVRVKLTAVGAAASILRSLVRLDRLAYTEYKHQLKTTFITFKIREKDKTSK